MNKLCVYQIELYDYKKHEHIIYDYTTNYIAFLKEQIDRLHDYDKIGVLKKCLDIIEENFSDNFFVLVNNFYYCFEEKIAQLKSPNQLYSHLLENKDIYLTHNFLEYEITVCQSSIYIYIENFISFRLNCHSLRYASPSLFDYNNSIIMLRGRDNVGDYDDIITCKLNMYLCWNSFKSYLYNYLSHVDSDEYYARGKIDSLIKHISFKQDSNEPIENYSENYLENSEDSGVKKNSVELELKMDKQKINVSWSKMSIPYFFLDGYLLNTKNINYYTRKSINYYKDIVIIFN